MNNTPVMKRPATLKRRFMAALAVVQAFFAKDKIDVTRTAQWQAVVKEHADRHGKHNGRTFGAFGGAKRAKAHRALYVAQT